MFDAMRVRVFEIPETFAKDATILVDTTAFETYTFPWTLRAFPKGRVPIPMLDATRVWVFAVPETLAKVAATLVLVTVFET